MSTLVQIVALALALTLNLILTATGCCIQVLLMGQLAHCGLPFLATQWAGECLPKGSQLSHRQLRSAERALRHLHAAGVVHGDVHAGNVLVAGDDVLLCDLARSRQRSSDSDFSNDWRSLEALSGTSA
jgi:predicted trehalose synthase